MFARLLVCLSLILSMVSNLLVSSLSSRDSDRRALRALLDTPSTLGLKKLMEADLGIGGRSRILRPVLYESKPIDLTREELYVPDDVAPSEVRRFPSRFPLV